MLPYWMNLMLPKKKDGDDKAAHQDLEQKRMHSRAYKAARTKAIRDGKSEVDLYLTSL